MKRIIAYLILSLIPFIALSQDVTKNKGKYYTQEGELYTGIHKDHYENGNLKAEIRVKKGVLEGRSVFHFKDGSKKELRSYKAGKMHGVWKTWNKEGVKVARAVYKNGKRTAPGRYG